MTHSTHSYPGGLSQAAFPRALVIGLGVTGLSVLRFLHQNHWQVTVVDTRLDPPYLEQARADYPEVEIITGNIPYHQFDQYEKIVISPGVALDYACLEQSGFSLEHNPILGDIELFAQRVKVPVIGITGSNGKSTVTMLLDILLRSGGARVKTGGNIGKPALDLLEGEEPDFYVLELSSFQLDSTESLRLKSAALLNISEDHLDRYADFASYVDSKLQILPMCESQVLNRADIKSFNIEVDNHTIITIGLDYPVGQHDYGLMENQAGSFIVKGRSILFNTQDLYLQGRHNVLNIMAALALLELSGVMLDEKILSAAKAFPGLPHRCELVQQTNGVKWINDSKATNVGATIAALSGFNEKQVLIAGGQGKGADFSKLSNHMENVVHCIVFGEDAEKIHQGLLCGEKPLAEITQVVDLKAAITLAHQITTQPLSEVRLVLFSPACASFDMFENFEHRGRVFRQWVAQVVS